MLCCPGVVGDEESSEIASSDDGDDLSLPQMLISSVPGGRQCLAKVPDSPVFITLGYQRFTEDHLGGGSQSIEL